MNVALSATNADGLADVTDVDVLAMRFDALFAPRLIAVSCKGGEAKSLSPAKEAFYLRGVLDYLGADEGVVAVARRLDPQHRDLARHLDILALSGEEVDDWCNALVNGLPDAGYFTEELEIDYRKQLIALPKTGLAVFLKTDFWFHRDFRNIQNLIGYLRKQQPALDGSSRLHTVQFLEVAAHFSLSVMQLCQYTVRHGMGALSDSVSSYLFGGATSYKARRDLYSGIEKVLTATGAIEKGTVTLPLLVPAYTAELCELVLRLCERPQSAVDVPLVLQDALWCALGSKGRQTKTDKNSLASYKLAEDLMGFLARASGTGWSPVLSP